MALNKVGKVSEWLINLRRFTRFRIFYMQKDNFSVTQVHGKMSDKPITYSKTEASKLTVQEIFYHKSDPAVLPVERHIVLGSLIVFLIYFCILREENVLDEIIGGTYRYEEDDEIKLVNALLFAKLKGLKTDDIERKLNEIRAKK